LISFLLFRKEIVSFSFVFGINIIHISHFEVCERKSKHKNGDIDGDFEIRGKIHLVSTYFGSRLAEFVLPIKNRELDKKLGSCPSKMKFSKSKKSRCLATKNFSSSALDTNIVEARTWRGQRRKSLGISGTACCTGFGDYNLEKGVHKEVKEFVFIIVKDEVDKKQSKSIQNIFKTACSRSNKEVNIWVNFE